MHGNALRAPYSAGSSTACSSGPGFCYFLILFCIFCPSALQRNRESTIPIPVMFTASLSARPYSCTIHSAPYNTDHQMRSQTHLGTPPFFFNGANISGPFALLKTSTSNSGSPFCIAVRYAGLSVHLFNHSKMPSYAVKSVGTNIRIVVKHHTVMISAAVNSSPAR